MKTPAAVLVACGRPLEVVDLEIPLLRPGQVLVEMSYSGVCHTQVGEWLGWRGPDPFLPHCLGHEGTGTVREVGPQVTRCRAGDRVILSWIKGGGLDVPGTQYGWGDRVVNAGGVTTFSRWTVVSENRVTVAPPGLSAKAAALVGCAVATGFGAVLRAGALEPGQRVVVFGVGGIGLCAVAAAAARGAAAVVAVDTRPARLEIARRLGATAVVPAGEADPTAALQALAPQGWDLAIEATGLTAVMRQALTLVRPRGGRAVVIGNARFGEELRIDPREFNQGKQLRGTWGGDSLPDRDFLEYCDWIARGLTPVEQVLDREYSLDQTTQALEDLHHGRCTRPLIHLSA